MPQYTRKNSLRLLGYDYTQSGAYFVTILTWKRLHLFGSITDGVMSLSEHGELVHSCWQQIPQHFPAVELDVSVIMPNHLHGILLLHHEHEQPVSLSVVINSFKGAVTRLTRQGGTALALDHPIWHRSFHDHIIRSDQEYQAVAQYVVTNPIRWNEDRLKT